MTRSRTTHRAQQPAGQPTAAAEGEPAAGSATSTSDPAPRAGVLERLRSRRRRTVRVDLPRPDRQDDALAYLRARDALAAGVDLGPPAVAAYERLAAQADELVDSLSFTALSAAEFEEVLAEHPGKDGLADTGWPVLLAACCDEDDLDDPEAWEELLDTLPYGQVTTLRSAVWELSTALGVVAQGPSGRA